MGRSKPTDPDHRSQEVQAAPTMSRPAPDGPPGYRSPNELTESWDPSDDENRSEEQRPVNWNWHGRQSWGRRAVAAFPIVGILLAGALFVHTTASAQGAIDQVQSVVGTGGATLLSSAPPTAAGGHVRRRPALRLPERDLLPTERAEHGRSRAAPPWRCLPYVGWEANGSAGADNGFARVSGGLLHVGVRRATTGLPRLVPHHHGHDTGDLRPPVLGRIASTRRLRVSRCHR